VAELVTRALYVWADHVVVELCEFDDIGDRSAASFTRALRWAPALRAVVGPATPVSATLTNDQRKRFIAAKRRAL
jgi:hypothetical protein